MAILSHVCSILDDPAREIITLVLLVLQHFDVAILWSLGINADIIARNSEAATSPFPQSLPLRGDHEE